MIAKMTEIRGMVSTDVCGSDGVAPSFPTGRRDRAVVVVTGPPGCGKSRFVRDELLPALHKAKRGVALLELQVREFRSHS